MTLEAWLEIATRNLVTRAELKVREEITGHVELSTRQHQLEGMGFEEARALAVQELGDPTKTAQSFEKNYLTNEELKQLVKDKRDASGQGWGALFWNFLAVLMLSTFLYIQQDSSERSDSQIMIFSLAFYTLSGYLAGKYLSLIKFSSIDVLRSIIIICMFCTIIYFDTISGKMSILSILLYTFFVMFFYFYFRNQLIRLRKLTRA